MLESGHPVPHCLTSLFPVPFLPVVCHALLPLPSFVCFPTMCMLGPTDEVVHCRFQNGL